MNTTKFVLFWKKIRPVLLPAIVVAVLVVLSLADRNIGQIFWLLPILAASWVAPSSRSTGDLITAAIWNQDIVDNVQFLYDRIPRRATLWSDERRVVAGNALLMTVDTSLPHNAQWKQDPPADGDTTEIGFFLQEGTYTIYVHGQTSANSGKVDWYIDDVLVSAGQDWYAGSVAYSLKSISSVSVVGSGRHVLRMKVNGKNGSSSSYQFRLIKVCFVPAADDIEVD